MKSKYILSLILATALTLTACSGGTAQGATGGGSSNESLSGEADTSKTASNENAAAQDANGSSTALDTATAAAVSSFFSFDEMFTERDLTQTYDLSAATQLTLSNESVTISQEGVYHVTGQLTDGQIIVDVPDTDKVQLILDNVEITCSSSAAIYVKQADKVFITLAANSQNTLRVSGEYVSSDITEGDNVDGVIFSKDDIVFNGSGFLTIQADYGHGIVGKDDVKVTGGTYMITAASHGISAKDSLRIADGSFTITSGKDGMHAENADDASLGFIYLVNGSAYITAEGDGISASNMLEIDDGTFAIETGGGSSTVTLSSGGTWGWGGPGGQQMSSTTEDSVSVKGIKASGDLIINNGDFSIDSADDALHSNANLTLNGGTFDISTGDDGIHADETVFVTSGNITIAKSYEGIEGQVISIAGGAIDLIASDDGLNAAGGNDASGYGGFGGFQKGGFDANENCSIEISGGTLHINASGDGIDSNGSLVVSGGETYISGPTDNANGALDYNGEATISGGIFIAAGSLGMAQSFGNNSTQASMLISLSGSANDAIILKDSSDTALLNWTADKAFSCVVISCPLLLQGETYTVSAGSASQEVTMDSLIFSDGMSGDFRGGKGGGMNKGGSTNGNENPNEGDTSGGFGGGFGGGKGSKPGDRPDGVSGATPKTDSSSNGSPDVDTGATPKGAGDGNGGAPDVNTSATPKAGSNGSDT